jgi:SAM-dependent methyltransferase
VPVVNFSSDDETAGAREAFEDAALYDFEYRRRRNDVRFYRRIAEERLETGAQSGAGKADAALAPAEAEPILDAACGTGRLLLPMVRDGHTVVGLDLSPAMLARAAARTHRLSPSRRRRALLVKGDLRALPAAPRFGLVVAAFHSVQHLVAEADLLAFFAAARAALVPGGWLAFDVLPPDPTWIHRDSTRRWGRTVFRHPVTRQRFVYTNNHTYDAERRAIHIRLYYQPVDQHGHPTGPEEVRRLCHRQLDPVEVRALLGRVGLNVIASFGAFDGRPLSGPNEDDEHIYVAQNPRVNTR